MLGQIWIIYKCSCSELGLLRAEKIAYCNYSGLYRKFLRNLAGKPEWNTLLKGVKCKQNDNIK